MSRADSALPIVIRLIGTVWGCLVAGAAMAQPPPPPPNPGIPPGPNIAAPQPPPAAAGYPTTTPGTSGAGYPSAGGSSTTGSSGVLRVMVPDTRGAPAATPTGTGAPAAVPSGHGQPDFRAPPPPPAGTSTTGKPAFPNDPTVPNAEIRAILEGAGRDNTAPAAPAVPTMRVRARVFVAGQPPVAVLEINGRQLTVREGSDIFVWGEDSRPGMQLRVARMTTSEIRLEVVNKDQYFTLD